MKSNRLFLVIVLTVLAGVLVSGRRTFCANVPDGEVQLVEGLRQRRLFSVAELACTKQLEHLDVTEREYVEWCVELIRTRASRANHAAPQQRDTQWLEAYQAAEECRQAARKNEWLILVDVQEAITQLAEAELARMEAEIAAQPDAALVHAREKIRKAAGTLGKLQMLLADRITRTADSSTSERPSADELRALLTHVRLAQARGFRNRALCYPLNSDDRVGALTQSDQVLKDLMGRLRLGDPLIWDAQLEHAMILRLLSDRRAAERLLDQLMARKPPDRVRREAVSERVLLELAGSQWQSALSLLVQYRKTDSQSVPQLDFSELRIYVTAWKSAEQEHDEQAARQFQSKATATVKYLESTYGPYWGRRGEVVLLATAGHTAMPGNLEILRRTAEQFYHKKQWDDAIRAFEKTASQADELRQEEAAFQARYRAALIEQKLKRYAAAGKRLRQLALVDAAGPKSAEVHLLAAWNLAQAVRGDQRSVDSYLEALTEHLDLWSTSPTADQARWWLGSMLEARHEWQKALSVLRQVSPGSPRFADSVRSTGRCWQQHLESLQAEGKPVEDESRAAVEWLESVILSDTQQWPERWSPAQCEAVVQAARLRLAYDRKGGENAEKLLTAALKDTPDSPAKWKDQAQLLLVAALAAQHDRQAEAIALLDKWSSGDVVQRLRLIEQLTQTIRSAPETLRPQLAKVQLVVIEQVEASGQPVEDEIRARIAGLHAQALRDTGQTREALQRFERLARDRPRDKKIQIDFAQLLLESSEPETLGKAIVQWRKVASHVPPDSDDWYRARYSIALAFSRRNQTGDRAEAAKRLKYLKAISRVDQTVWKDRVNQLLDRCRS